MCVCVCVTYVLSRRSPCVSYVCYRVIHICLVQCVALFLLFFVCNTSVCMYTYVCMYTCVCVCVCVTFVLHHRSLRVGYVCYRAMYTLCRVIFVFFVLCVCVYIYTYTCVHVWCVCVTFVLYHRSPRVSYVCYRGMHILFRVIFVLWVRCACIYIHIFVCRCVSVFMSHFCCLADPHVPATSAIALWGGYGQ